MRVAGSAEEDSEGGRGFVGFGVGEEESVVRGEEEGFEGFAEDVEDGRGEVLVGPALMKVVIRSGTLEGVTLSTSVKEGRTRTEVVVSEGDGLVWSCSGRGMLEAESMSLCGEQLANDRAIKHLKCLAQNL